jgi:serine/threonine protein kinase
MRFRRVGTAGKVARKDEYRVSIVHGCKSLETRYKIYSKLLVLFQPERIKGESQNNLGTYTVSSDVWSVGLSIIEIGLGHYPYPPETYSNVFAQLTAIVHGDSPNLPDERYSETARDWVESCLRKLPEARASYAELLVSLTS